MVVMMISTPLRLLKVVRTELNLDTVIKSGQSFRWKKLDSITATRTGTTEDGEGEGQEWALANMDRTIVIRQDNKGVHYRSLYPSQTHHATIINDITNDTTGKWLTQYLRLDDISLKDLYSQWRLSDKHFDNKLNLDENHDRLTGIRVLAQDSWETLISFICSSNNNIPRITLMLDRLSTTLGNKLPHPSNFNQQSVVHLDKPFPTTNTSDQDAESLYSFPTPSSLAQPTTDQLLRSLGFGYRAPYIQHTAQSLIALAHEQDLSPLQYLDTLRCPKHQRGDTTMTLELAREKLIQFKGVGRKVADCILLFGLGWDQVVPVDTHVYQIAVRDYSFPRTSSGNLTPELHDRVANKFRSLWGDKAGWAQQVLFFDDLKLPSSSSSAVGTPEKRKRKRDMHQPDKWEFEPVPDKTKWEMELEEIMLSTPEAAGRRSRRRMTITTTSGESVDKVLVKDEEDVVGDDAADRYPTPVSVKVDRVKVNKEVVHKMHKVESKRRKV
ncbi:DNA glycosylase [Meredithblackwellia eburnea MCA 4105]